MEGFTFSPSAGPSNAQASGTVNATLGGDFNLGYRPKGIAATLAQNLPLVVLAGVAIWLIKRKK